MNKKHALVIGATGASGQEIVNLLLKDPNYDIVNIFVRRKIERKDAKLNVYVIDFSQLHLYKELIKGDILFSALGTTIKNAGSKDKQYLVDYTYQYEFAKIASENGVDTLSLISSIGANKKSVFFYPKIKGKLEESVKLLPFKKIQIYQPPSLIRQVELIRFGEKVSVKLFQWLNSVGLFKSLRPMSVSFLASKIVSNSHLIKKDRVTTFKPIDIFN
ncbi:MAG: semialdehyde dehydrogenase [Flavobacteriales bacterium]|nr:semialdehyde dehydrogenase [Flavobacteriales bacterium]|tara:strand:+ start:6629 stop:7279 length:651 start_codon:yes stop_codon:yes gene_type:complete